ncbi:hypothetical protein AQ938_07010 [Burkholderia pseudomallei]|uniref:hypothetical protein n=1 Tax=Burkholderia pseudomallei TaxID=28450 RepID=UPI00015F7CD0|nr:hypothetical protein [Burkholderia pseudomallei]AJX62021.1 hypothetical protein DP47_3365 [Burkholderia pseudomallei Pasteur 52237]EDO95595.1 hypothetical protein BURPSPAST_C1327 [Burkholderia pseudomallei Pasteur 52237]MWA16597.1 hypothetical protein [Burkholderia pseudomallei]OND79022.1 hypothetical protein AQ938_07010 [Burkholderia pseudomallei]VBQ80841.1 phage-related tail protein [Burkholderia pseudomallei]
MAFEAYKIAVKLSLVDGVSRGLAALSSHFLASGKSAAQLEDRLKSIKRLMLAGGALTATGIFGLKVLETPLDKATQYEKYVAKMRQMGLGDAQIQDAKKFVQANEVIGTSMLDRMRLFSEAQGSFRESGMSGLKALDAAKTMTPVLATYEVAMATLDDKSHAKAEGAMRNLNKTIEMMGGLGDTKRAQEIADGVFKASQSSGGMVDERHLKQFFAYGSSASNQQLLRTVFGGLEPIIGELGGSTVGTGMRTAYNRVNGTMALVPKNVRRELKRLGMARDATGMEQTDALARLQASDVIGYVQDIMRRYEKAGIKTQIDRERENSILFGTNGAKIYNKLMSQMSVIEESLHAYDKAQGASQVVNDPANQKLQAQRRFEKKIEDLQLTIGRDGGLLDMLNRGLTFLGGAIERVTKFAEGHPKLTKFAVGGFAFLSMVTIIAGEVLLLGGAFRALSTAIAFTRVGSTMVRIAQGSRLALMALRPVGNGLVFLGGIVRGLLGPFALLARGLLILGRALAMGAIGGIGGIIRLAGALAGTATTALSGALAALVSPLGIVVLALGTLAAAAYAFSPISQKEIDSYKTDGGVKLTASAAARLAAVDSGATTNGPNIGPRQQSVVHLQHQTLLDGRVIADSAAKYIVGSMNAPVGTGAVDTRQTMPAVGSPYPFR